MFYKYFSIAPVLDAVKDIYEPISHSLPQITHPHNSAYEDIVFHIEKGNTLSEESQEWLLPMLRPVWEVGAADRQT